MTDVWKPVHQPTRRELEERERKAQELNSTPQPVPGRPGFTICNGRLQYDPSKDPSHAYYGRCY